MAARGPARLCHRPSAREAPLCSLRRWGRWHRHAGLLAALRCVLKGFFCFLHNSHQVVHYHIWGAPGCLRGRMCATCADPRTCATQASPHPRLRRPAAHRVGASGSRGDQHGHGDGHRRLGRARDAGGGVRGGQRGRRRRLGRLGRRRRGGGHKRDRRAAPGALAPRAHMCAKRRRRRIGTLASVPFHAEGQGCLPYVWFQCAAVLAVHAAGLGMAGEQPLAATPEAPATGRPRGAQGTAWSRRPPRPPPWRQQAARRSLAPRCWPAARRPPPRPAAARPRSLPRPPGPARRPRQPAPAAAWPPKSSPMTWRRGWLRGLAAVQTGVPPGGRCQSSERERAGRQQACMARLCMRRRRPGAQVPREALEDICNAEIKPCTLRLSHYRASHVQRRQAQRHTAPPVSAQGPASNRRGGHITPTLSRSRCAKHLVQQLVHPGQAGSKVCADAHAHRAGRPI